VSCSKAGCVDEDAVGGAFFYDFRVAGYYVDAGLFGGFACACEYFFKRIDIESLFDDKRKAKGYRSCACDREVVYRSANSEFADVAAVEE